MSKKRAFLRRNLGKNCKKRRDYQKKRLVFILFIILAILTITLILNIIPLRPSGYATKLLGGGQVQFYFYDEATSCSLDGYVFSGDKLLGRAYKGYFNLTYENFIDNFNSNSNISIFGKLGRCFGSDLFFDKYWEGIQIDSNYFSGDSIFYFKANVNPRNPYERELLGFIQTNLTSELENSNINRLNLLDDFSRINWHLNSEIEYEDDSKYFNGTDYWQTPEETIELKRGDCEDFASLLLSLFLTYDSSVNCHNLIFSSHVTTFCHINDYYIYYDQGKTELKAQIKETGDAAKEKLKELKKEYLRHYGISENDRAYYAFDNNEVVKFENNEDFINWEYTSEKKSGDIFEELSLETAVLEEKYPLREPELATENPVLATEKPSLRGFLEKNFWILAILAALFIILVIILIKISFHRFGNYRSVSNK